MNKNYIKTIKDYLNRFVDIILPPRCFSCKKLVTKHHTLCAECFEKINFISEPFCEKCGLPFPYDIEGETICGECIRKTPIFEKALSIVHYDDGSKKLILSFKHGDVTDVVPAFTNWIIQHAKEFIDTTDIIVPVPIHRIRLLKRRYNQSALISNALGIKIKKHSVPDLMIRTKNTPPQGHKGIISRKKNIRGAFSINPKYLKHVEGKKVLLIDDVYTTGATINECTKTLLKAKAKSVKVLTIARVFRNLS